jgi:hypothetical protein
MCVNERVNMILQKKNKSLRMFHTMAVGQEDNKFQQFDWWRAKVCLLGLHTKDQKPPKCLGGSTFVSFGTKSLSGGRKFLQDIDGNPNSPFVDKLFFRNLHKLSNLHILTPKVLCFIFSKLRQHGICDEIEKLKKT